MWSNFTYTNGRFTSIKNPLSVLVLCASNVMLTTQTTMRRDRKRVLVILFSSSRVNYDFPILAARVPALAGEILVTAVTGN
jgi:hypothetical protein